MLKPKLTKHLFELEALKTSKKCDFQSFNSSENEIKELIDSILLQIQIFLDSNKKENTHQKHRLSLFQEYNILFLKAYYLIAKKTIKKI